MDSIIDYIAKDAGSTVIRILKEYASSPSVSIKVDGAPALVIWNNVRGLRGPGVSFKLLPQQLQKGVPGIYFTTEQEIDRYFSEHTADEHRIQSFKQALKLARKVRPGIFLWGDVLYSSRGELIDEPDGIGCKPNFLEYVFVSSTFKERIEKSEFGIYFHTIVDGAAFGRKPVGSLSGILAANSQFCLSPKELEPVTQDSKSIRMDITELDALVTNLSISKKEYVQFRKFVKNKDVSLLSNFQDQDKESILEILEVVNRINSKILDSYTVSGYYTKVDGVRNDGEGFVVSNNAGSVKIVPQDFTVGNIEHMHNRKLTEKFEGAKIVLYSTSKDMEFPTYFSKKELKFANNAGNNYGLGIYTTFDVPERSNVGYKDRKSLYGDIVYKFVGDSKKFICFDYNMFRSSPLFSELDAPKEEDFISAQFRYFGIGLDAGKYTPSSTLTQPKAVYAFFLAMSEEYYERADGTLSTPVDGLVYHGRNDGDVAVVWSPYNLELVSRIVDGNEEKLDIHVESTEEDNESRIFDGKVTDRKKEAYRLLRKYSKDNYVAGIFSNIVIHEDTIDVTFKSLLPQRFGNRHVFIVTKDENLEKLTKLGFRIGRLDAWLGINYDYSGQLVPTKLKDLKFAQLPDRVTGGIYVAKTELDSTACSKLNRILPRTNGSCVLYKCFLTAVESLHADRVELSSCGALEPIEVRIGSKTVDNSNIVKIDSLGDLLADHKPVTRKKKSPKVGLAKAVAAAKEKLGAK